MQATAALAMLAATVCIVQAGNIWMHQGPGGAADALFFLGLGSGAAYFGMVLPRRVVSAWRACRQLAAAAGTINMVVLPSLIVACLITLGFSLWQGLEVSHAQWASTLFGAGAATALPWVFYHALGDDRVRGWFCVADCQ